MLCTVGLTGCSAFPKGMGKLSTESGEPLQGSESAAAFQRIREAKSQNSIVLQVSGDSQPIRVLPLPQDGTPVFVSDLLRQTGLQDKFGRMMVTVHRSSEFDYVGAKMDVRFDDSGKIIRPETDYCLQAGDRIKIAKDPRTSFGSLLDEILPTNASRAIVGF